MKIKAVLQTFSSELDRNGNTYHAFRYHDTQSGAVVEGIADSESAITMGANSLIGTDYLWISLRMKKRDFMAKVNKWKSTDNVKVFILNSLNSLEPQPQAA